MIYTTVLTFFFAFLSFVNATPMGRRAPNQTLTARAKLTSAFNVTGYFIFTGYTDGRPTLIQANISGLVNNSTPGGGPYAYHIHTNPIGPDGNCAAAFGHLDPYNVTDSIVCNKTLPQFCQEGDLSGKLSKITATTDNVPIPFNFTDNFVRFFPEEVSILGRSIVIHSANKTRLACANITSLLDGTEDKAGNPTFKPSAFVKKYPTAPSPQPTEITAPFNGTYPPKTFIDNMPYPLPLHAVGLNESVNIAFRFATRVVRIHNVNTTVTQPKGFAIPGTGPF